MQDCQKEKECGNCGWCKLQKILKAEHCIEKKELRQIALLMMGVVQQAHDLDRNPNTAAQNPNWICGMLTGIVLAIDSLNVATINDRNFKLIIGALGQAVKSVQHAPSSQAIIELAKKEILKEFGTPVTEH